MGEGLEKNMEKAVHWYTKAAAGGDQRAEEVLNSLRKNAETDD